ncbi:MAG: ADP-ribosylglycohydrolase family protein [Bacteroidota bacterium]
MTTLERFQGCLLGLAIGDAVGTTLEFRKPGTFLPITDMVGGGPFDLRVGKWTDDTSMALCLAQSFIQKGEFDARDQMNRYLNWYHHGYMSSTGGCFDIGNTVIHALTRYELNKDPIAGSTDPYSAGNGSLMRLAPVPMFYAKDPQEAIRMSGESSRTTHGATAAVDACCFYGGLIVAALHGADRETLLSPLYKPQGERWESGTLDGAIDRVAAGSYVDRQPPDIAGTGYVVKSMEAALWAFHTTDNFRDGCLAAANLGDDADTTAAIFGQLAGAYYGLSGLPADWRIKVHMAKEITDMATKLYEMSGMEG